VRRGEAKIAERRAEEGVPLRTGVRRFVPRTAQPLGDARDVAQQPPLLEGQVAVEDPKLQVVRDGNAERTKNVQNEYKTVKGVEEALPRPASKGARLVNETGFSADRDARVQGGGVVRK
jgi:hypothetical protein